MDLEAFFIFKSNGDVLQVIFAVMLENKIYQFNQKVCLKTVKLQGLVAKFCKIQKK